MRLTRKSFFWYLFLLILFIYIFFSPKTDPVKRAVIDGYRTGIRLYTGQGDRPMAHMFNPHPFSTVINPKRCTKDVFLMVYVYSSPNHFDERMAIRRSWGNVTLYDVVVRVVFVLGLTQSPSDTARIHEESSMYTDIVQESFIDAYRNLTIKGMAALKWVVKNCDRAKFVMKTDDDMVINLFRWVDVLQKECATGVTRKGLIRCNVYYNSKIMKGGKFAVDQSTWPYETYPTYCDGRAYTMSPDVVPNLYMMAHYTRFFWIADVYFTGLLPSLLGNITHKRQNHYCIHGEYRSDANHIFVDLSSKQASERASVWKEMLNFELEMLQRQ